MGYNCLGQWGGEAMFFPWLTYILVWAVLILSIVALWKYINKK